MWIIPTCAGAPLGWIYGSVIVTVKAWSL
jgi:hypothetical protein